MIIRVGKLTILSLGVALALAAAGALSGYELSSARPAKSLRLAAWEAAGQPPQEHGLAFFSYGDFGALDLDTLATAAVPWPFLAASLALAATDGRPDLVAWPQVERAFRGFGFLYPERIDGLSAPVPAASATKGVPLGLSVGTVTRAMPPLRLDILNVGCAACHAGPSYGADGKPELARAVPGMPNTSLDLEGFTTASYAALKRASADADGLFAAIARLFPDMGPRERLTLRWLALPRARSQLATLVATIDRPLPFPNGLPGSTNGVAALKHQLRLTPRDAYQPGAGFVSIPVIAERAFRSALLVDGAYAVPGERRFREIGRAEAEARGPAPQAAIASFFTVPSMGMTDARAADAIPDLTEVMRWLRAFVPPPYPGPVDRALASTGRDVYARACASCHGRYDASLERPRLESFPNWAGDVGTDRSRVDAFTPALAAAVGRTLHGRAYLDAAATGRTAAPLLAGLWASAPYFVNGSVPTIRHLLEPATRPRRFSVGGHRLDLARLGIAGEATPDGDWAPPPDARPFSTPVTVDTAQPGFSNRGHEAEVAGLSAADRDALIEYLKLL